MTTNTLWCNLTRNLEWKSKVDFHINAQTNVISEVKETGEKCKAENAGKMRNFSLKKANLELRILFKVNKVEPISSTFSLYMSEFFKVAYGLK